jgi:hypothetical protein
MAADQVSPTVVSAAGTATIDMMPERQDLQARRLRRGGGAVTTVPGGPLARPRLRRRAHQWFIDELLAGNLDIRPYTNPGTGWAGNLEDADVAGHGPGRHSGSRGR